MGKMCRRITKLIIVKSWLWLFFVCGFQVFYVSKTERLSSKYSATSFPGSSLYLRCFSWRHVLCDDHRDLSKAWLNKRERLWSPASIKGANKDAKIGWKVHDHAQSFLCSHTLCMNNITNTFILVSWYGVTKTYNKGLCRVS